MKGDSRLMKASLWLSGLLADKPMPAAEVTGEAARAGISQGTLRRAREYLAIVAQKQGFGKGARWLWRLPRAEDVQDERVRRSEIDGIDDELADFSFDLEEPALDTGQDFTLSAADLDYLSRLPTPTPRRR